MLSLSEQLHPFYAGDAKARKEASCGGCPAGDAGTTSSWLGLSHPGWVPTLRTASRHLCGRLSQAVQLSAETALGA